MTFFPRVNETDVIEGSQYNTYYGKLISLDINEEDQQLADNITTQLILTTSELKNGTKITCHTFNFQEEPHLHISSLLVCDNENGNLMYYFLQMHLKG